MRDITEKEGIILSIRGNIKSLKYLQKIFENPNPELNDHVKKLLDTMCEITMPNIEEKVSKFLEIDYDQVKQKIKKMKEDGEGPPVLPKGYS